MYQLIKGATKDHVFTEDASCVHNIEYNFFSFARDGSANEKKLKLKNANLKKIFVSVSILCYILPKDFYLTQ